MAQKMLTVQSKSGFKKANGFLEKLLETAKHGELDKYGREGVEALMEATPKRTGLTAESWKYEIERKNDQVILRWYNTNLAEDWANVALLIQKGHATKSGVYVKGIDYINPALRPVFEKIGNKAWKEVKGL